MKSLITVIALVLFAALPTANAADYYGQCKSELGKVASGLSSYMGGQSSECNDALNQPSSSRNQQLIQQNCKNTGTVAALKNRAYAVCGQCRRLNNATINNACTDNGASAFIDAVNSL